MKTISTYTHIPFSFIKLGRTCTVNGSRYQVVGRVRSETLRVKEWDPEDGVYATEPNYTTDEWILKDSYGRFVYLSEYANREWPFVFSQRIERPEGSVPPTQFIEEGESKVTFIEGENPDGEIVGETFRFKDFKENGQLYSCEWETDAGAMEGIWFYQDHEWTREQTLRAFGEIEQANRQRSKAAQRREYTSWAAIFTLLFWAGIIVSAALYEHGFGEKVYTASNRANGDTEQGIVFGPIALNDKRAVYNFVIKSSLGADGATNVLFRLIDKDNSILSEVTDEHWKESGVDYEGQWTEGHYETRYLMRLAEPGEYRVQVLSTPPFPWNHYLQLTVYKNPFLFRYAAISTCLLGIGMLYFSVKKKSV